MKNFEIVDLLPLHRQMTLVIFRDPDTRKCEVQILPVSLEAAEPKSLQMMLEIPVKPGTDAATVSVVVEESLSREILNWCDYIGTAGAAFIGFCGKPKNAGVLRARIRQETAWKKST